jgi:hypothetical protein
MTRFQPGNLLEHFSGQIWFGPDNRAISARKSLTFDYEFKPSILRRPWTKITFWTEIDRARLPAFVRRRHLGMLNWFLAGANKRTPACPTKLREFQTTEESRRSPARGVKALDTRMPRGSWPPLTSIGSMVALVGILIGVGFIPGTLMGVLILGLIQTLINFNVLQKLISRRAVTQL